MLGIFQTLRSHSTTRALWLIVAVVFLIVGAVAARSALRDRWALVASQASEMDTRTPQNGRDSRLISRVLTLEQTGFEPAEVNWQKEPFFLIIDNRTAITDLTLQINRLQGGRVKEVRLKMRKQRSAGVLDLTPGQYVLTEANHPDWVCRININ